MFKKILVANRGEIAVRIIRACQEMGIKTVAVYAEPDKESLPVHMADESICIGPPRVADSYLNIRNVISAAKVTGADAIHPGYGFLAENPVFAEKCAENGIEFIGPPPAVIRKMGEKALAREMMKRSGIPVMPGSDGPVCDIKEAVRVAEEIGYPVIVKASAGGGGRGMRTACSRDELKRAFATARSEAGAAFGNGEVYIEKFLKRAKHIEFQVLADKQGNIIHFGERDCSIQRRNQKLIEEAPSTALDENLRDEMGRTAVMAAQAAGYVSAGTIEFLLDANKKYYFMEMNTRIQVEHPVTELVAGVDLVKEQIRIACGETLTYRQENISFKGWAIECRICAEDPGRNFSPCVGKITEYLPPGGPGVRVDSAIYPGYIVHPHYDSLLGKLVVWGRDRSEAVARALRALGEFKVEGVATTIPFHRQVIESTRFKRGEVFTNFCAEIDQKRKVLLK